MSSAEDLNGSTKARKLTELSGDEDDQPLAKRPKRLSNGGSNGSYSRKPVSVKKEDSDDSDSDVPLTRRPSRGRVSSGAGSAKKEPQTPADSDSDSDDAPLGKKAAPASAARTKKSPGKATSAASTPTAKRKVKSESPAEEDEEEEEEEEEDGEEGGDDDEEDDKKSGGVKHTGDGGQMWGTLYHTGPRFPPDYQPLPSDIKLRYNGKTVQLPPAAEEAALFYAVKLETPYVKDPVFNSNFFKDFQKVLKKNPSLDGTKIDDFSKLDFTQMCEYQKGLKEAEKERKKKLAPSARKKEMELKKAAEEEMKSCLVDGLKQRVGNVMVEPPALFMGRGQHPKRGMIKPRVQPEEITINHTLKDSAHPPPPPPEGHSWKAVVEMKDVTWLAHWIDFNGNYKYVYLDAASSFKSNSDREKFEKARKLDKCVKKLRKRIDDMLVSKSRQERQLGTVVWLIDNYSLRAGNEKGEDEAATYGVCSLLVEHVKDLVDAENKVQLEFLGKDSMLFKETLEVPERIFKNIKMFTRSTKDDKGNIVIKKPHHSIFEKVDTADVNKFLRDPKEGGMPGLSAKVFRTYNASTTFQGLLNKTAENLEERGLEPTPQTLKDEYMQANRLVAILCNHQKTINPQVAERQLQRAEEKMVALKYDIHKERQKILTAYKSVKDVKKDFPAKDYKEFNWSKVLEEDLGITDEQIQAHEEKMIESKITRLEAAFERQELERQYQEEQARSGGSAVKKEEPAKKGRGKKAKKEESEDEDEKPKMGKMKTKADVDAEKKRLQDLLKTLEKERKTGKAQDADSIRVETCARKINQKFQAIKKFEADLESKQKTSDVSLGTSKLNYIDPRITVAWLKKWDAILVQQDQVVNASPKKGKGKVKAEEADEKKPAKGGRKSAAAVKAEKQEAEKLDLQLQKLPIGQYFPMTMQKKFKWSDFNDDQKPGLPPTWEFVPDATEKIRDNMSSARREELQNEVRETRKDDVSKGGKAARGASSAAAVNTKSTTARSANKVIKAGTNSNEKEQVPKSNGRGNGAAKAKNGRNSNAMDVDDAGDSSDSDVPLGAKK